MNVRLLAAAFLCLQVAALPAERTRPLLPGGSIREALAGGEHVVFTVDVPARSAARIVVAQQGIDVTLTLRRQGSRLPEHGLDLTAGLDGEEVAFPPVSDAVATWTVIVAASLPRAERGDYTISLEISAADDRTRAVAEARSLYQAASDAARPGDVKSSQQALAGYLASADVAVAADDRPLAAEATYQAARFHDILGDPPRAIELQRRALEMFRALGRRDREARVLNRLGDLSRKVGAVTDAERFFQEALPLARAAQDPATVADILNNSGLLLSLGGRFDEAIDQLKAAIPLAQEVDSASVEAALDNNIADAYRNLGAYEQSVEWFQRAVAVNARLNLPRRMARALHLMSRPYFEMGDRAKAEETMARALTLYEQSGDRVNMAEALAFSGRMQYAMGNTDGAVELFGRALPVLHEVQDRLGEANLLAVWAKAEIDRGDVDAALPKTDEAIRLARPIANPATLQRALYARALALQRKGRIADAIEAAAAVVDSVETMRGSLRSTELRTSYLAIVRSYFDLYIELLQRQGSPAAAFAMSERARARGLLDSLAESASKINKGADPALLTRLRQVQADLNAKEIYRAQAALKDGEKSPRAVAASRDVQLLLNQWNDLRSTVRAASPVYWALQAPEPVSVERIQQTLLDTDSALIEYHLGPAHSYAWVIDRHAITVHELPPSARVDEVARRYHELLSRDIGALDAAARAKLSAAIAAAGARLAAMAWKPVEARAGGKRLLIVADGVLQYVPFAALPSSTGEPLIARHEIVYLPSAAVLASIRQRSRPVQVNATAAVFADPVFSKNDARFAAQRDAAASARTRAADGGLYERLRFSRTEADAISAVAPGSFEALDFAASKQTLIGRDLRRFRILHFATHGSLNTEHPELSGLVLSLVDAAGRPVDGFLRLHEIYNLDLDADLVVLSACSTALGKEVHGEGLMGLTRGFMYAGASRVVSSVWNVDDRASARLMTAFYTAMLSKGLPPASALRSAQLALLHDPRWANPHYWAAFGLQGEWR